MENSNLTPEELTKYQKHFSESDFWLKLRTLAKKAGVKELWLTHYSPSMSYPKNYEGAARKIFNNTHVAKDGRSITLAFEDEEQGK